MNDNYLIMLLFAIFLSRGVHPFFSTVLGILVLTFPEYILLMRALK